MPHCTSQTSTATTPPHWISAQSFSSLEYFHFPHKAPHVIIVMFGRLLPFHPSKCSTYSIFTPEPLNTSAVSLETRDLYCQRNRNAKASCKMYAGTCKEQTKGTQSVLCKCFGFKESGRYFIHHPRQARKRIIEKSFARGMDIWHCKGSWQYREVSRTLDNLCQRFPPLLCPTSSFWKVALDVAITPSDQNSLCTSYWAVRCEDIHQRRVLQHIIEIFQSIPISQSRISWESSGTATLEQTIDTSLLGGTSCPGAAASSWGSKPYKAASMQRETFQKGLSSRPDQRYLYLTKKILLKCLAQSCSLPLPFLCLPCIPPVYLPEVLWFLSCLFREDQNPAPEEQ